MKMVKIVIMLIYGSSGSDITNNECRKGLDAHTRSDIGSGGQEGIGGTLVRKSPSVRSSISLSTRLFIHPSVCSLIHPSILPSVCLFVRPSVRLTDCLSVCHSVCLFIPPSVRLCVCPKPFVIPDNLFIESINHSFDQLITQYSFIHSFIHSRILR